MTQAFNLSQFANKVNTSGQASLTTAVTGTLPVANGGTGATSITAGSVVVGNGTSAVTTVAAGASGNVLTSNGSTWTSAAGSGGQYQTEIIATSRTWTKPASCSQVRVLVVGGGGGTRNTPAGTTQSGSVGGFAMATNVPVTAPVTVTIGAGGAANAAGGTSSFGSAVSATGGAAGTGAIGTGTVSSGTLIRASNTIGTALFYLNQGNLQNTVNTAARVYSATNPFAAGAGGGAGAFPTSGGGVGGVVIIEYVG